MRYLHLIIKNILIGMMIGSLIYLIILSFYPASIAIENHSRDVLIMSGLIGIASMIFRIEEMPFILELIIHFVLTISLCFIFLNYYLNNIWSYGLFILIYALVWLLLCIINLISAHKINNKIQARKHQSK